MSKLISTYEPTWLTMGSSWVGLRKFLFFFFQNWTWPT